LTSTAAGRRRAFLVGCALGALTFLVGLLTRTKGSSTGLTSGSVGRSASGTGLGCGGALSGGVILPRLLFFFLLLGCLVPVGGIYFYLLSINKTSFVELNI